MTEVNESDELKEFLDRLKLERYYDVLLDAGYETYEDLKVMDEKDLAGLDIKLPHKKRILKEVEKMIGPPSNKPVQKPLVYSENTHYERQEVHSPQEKVSLNWDLGKKESEKTTALDMSELNYVLEEEEDFAPPVRRTTKQLNALLLPACQSGRLEDVRRFLAEGANAVDKGLCCAASGGHKEIALLMIEKGAKDFNKAFLIACKSGNRDLVVEMMKRGATNLSEGLKVAEERKNEALILEIKRKIFLIEGKIFENETIASHTPLRTTKQLNALLLAACQSGQFAEAKKLIEEGAKALDKALGCACSGGHKKLAYYLIEKGAKDFNNALLSACKSGNREMAIDMVERGANNLEEAMEAAKVRKEEDIEFELERRIKMREQNKLKLQNPGINQIAPKIVPDLNSFHIPPNIVANVFQHPQYSHHIFETKLCGSS